MEYPLSTGVHLSDEELRERLALFDQYGSASAVARELGINESSVRRSIRTAVRRGLSHDFDGPPPAEGYQYGRITRLVKGGNSILEWQRLDPSREDFANYVDELIRAMGQKIQPIAEVVPVFSGDEDLLAMYPVVDVHLGQLSWHPETGEDYDLSIARSEFKRSVGELLLDMPLARTALIVILGDYFHADNNNAETSRSKNRLDVDSRHRKAKFVGMELAVWFIDMALQQHQRVIVHVSRGNHDEESSAALAMALYFRYLENPHVEVDIDPKELWSFEWGTTMLGFTHGDRIKAQDMPGVMAGQWAELWGRTKYRFAYSGHYHREVKGPVADEKHGARWEILPAFTAKDAFNKSIGSSSLRVIKGLVFHKERGLKKTLEVTVENENRT